MLLALAWPNHQHHAVAHAWFARGERYGWATCALTELGFIRLSSNPAYTPAAVSPGAAAALLEQLVAHKNHLFWPSPAAAAVGMYARALGHQQVNDAYLVEIVRQRKARLVTLDSRLASHDSGLVLVLSSAV